MSTLVQADELERFIAALFEPEDLIELRLKPEAGHGARCSFHAAHAFPAEAMARYRKGDHAFFSANPRKREGGTNEDVALARCLFLDLDKVPSEEEALEIIAEGGLPDPSVLLSSGGGFHAYWRLEEPMRDLDYWRTSTHSLLAAIGRADPKCKDPARILRLPGFINPKPERDGAVAHIARASGTRHRLTDLLEGLLHRPAPSKPMPSPARERSLSSASDTELEDALERIGDWRSDDRDEWVKVGLALKAHGESMHGAWHRFSAKSPKYSFDDAEYQWRTFEPRQAQASWIFAKAIEDSPKREPPPAPAEPMPPVASFSEALEEALEYCRKHQGEAEIGIPTRRTFPSVSSMLFGWRGLIFLAAEPGIGKTAFCMEALLDAVASTPDTCGVFFSFEMPLQELALRMLQGENVGYRKLVTGDFSRHGTRDPESGLQLSREDAAAVLERAERLKAIAPRLHIHAGDFPTLPSDDPTKPLEAIVQSAKEKSGCSRAFVVIDYFQAMRIDAPGGRWADELERDRSLVAELRDLQKRLGEDDPLLVISEQSKADIKTGAGSMMAMLGSGRVSYCSGAVLLLRDPERYRNTEPQASGRSRGEDARQEDNAEGFREIECLIAKGRAGMERSAIGLRFHFREHRYEEIQR